MKYTTDKTWPKAERCCELIPARVRSDGFRPHRCYRTATVEIGGKYYCTTHNPEFVTKKRQEKQALWDKQMEIRTNKMKRRSLEENYCKGLTNEELERGRI